CPDVACVAFNSAAKPRASKHARRAIGVSRSRSGAYSRYPRKSHRDPPPAKAGSRVDKLRRAVPPWPTERVAEKTGLDIGEVERPVVMGVIAVRKTFRGRNSARSDAEESQESEQETIRHIARGMHDDTPLAPAAVHIYSITSIEADRSRQTAGKSRISRLGGSGGRQSHVARP